MGLENHDPFGPKWEWLSRDLLAAQSIQRFKKQLDLLLKWGPTDHWSAEEKDRVRNKISFQTFRHYLESGDWGEELSWQLVGRWLNALDAREKGLMKPPEVPFSKAEKMAAKKIARNRMRKRQCETCSSESESEWEPTEADWDNDQNETPVMVDPEEEDY